ncbi:MAG: hypothetical protein CSA11_06660 [Chloroflexi bacterium]|nr:MAG: hypothetical protein CSB13_00815 [Chloroflexota bacterium]PIE80901.1 MAG: hypothetical protein CSA11_06660 [Chloroflexota bacterium]
MVIAMILAHLVGDYILQWDALAAWKSRELKGVVTHCIIISLTTMLFALPFQPYWWPGVLFISATHFLIDASQLYVKPPIPALARFLLDQTAHFIVIFSALALGGYSPATSIITDFTSASQSEHIMLFILGYACITMPAWVLVKFTSYGLVQGTAPEFPGRTNKYIEILERILITTFVFIGQYFLIPVVILPRLITEWPDVQENGNTTLYLVELLSSITIATLIGIWLKQI